MLLEVLFQTVKHKKYEAFLKIKKYKKEQNESPLVDTKKEIKNKINPKDIKGLIQVL